MIARQARYGGGSRGGFSEPLPVDLTAGTRYAVAENVITTWARHVDEEGVALPHEERIVGPTCSIECGHVSCRTIRRGPAQLSLPEITRWLASQVGWLRMRPEAAEAFDELGDACAVLRRLVDRPVERELVGVCDCGKVLYAVAGREVIQCPMPTCKLIWHVERSREILRRHLGDKLVTLPEAARLSAYLDGDRTQEAIRKLLSARFADGRLAQHGERGGEPVFRFGEVVTALAAVPKRKRREAVEMGA